MRFLISNDDGVHARGLSILHNEIKKLGHSVVVAPTEEKSTTGHSLTIHKPLRIIEMSKNFYGVTGSPADCVCLGLREIMKKAKPDFVISGINRGANLGQDVYYSGTVSAAREACFWGVPAIAVSLAVDFGKHQKEEKLHYETAAKVVARMVKLFKNIKLPKHTLLNLNVPDVPLNKVKGLVLARQGFRFYSGDILKRRDHRGRNYFWVGGQYKGFHNEPGTDCHAVDHGYASLTPLKMDTTHSEFIESLQEMWSRGV